MRAYGSDRVKPRGGDQFVLFSRRSKGWVPRTPKTLTTAEYPGTAVVWEERIFEVAVAESNGTGGVRYVLEPWRDQHIIRVSDSYDEASELRRDAEYRANVARQKGRKAANLFGVFTGHLPAVVQEHLASELGLLPTKLTSLSLLLPLAYLAWCANDFARRLLDSTSGPMPIGLLVLAAYLFIESVIRLNIVWFHRRPIGSLAGVIAYLLYYLLIGKWRGGLSPFTVPKGQKLFFTEPSDDVALRDAFKLREPLVTLLSPEEQAAIAKRFGYEYRTQSFVLAFVLLFMALAGVITSLVKLEHGPSITALLSLLAAGGIALEQVFRLMALKRGPAGSVLAVFVRPFMRKLLK